MKSIGGFGSAQRAISYFEREHPGKKIHLFPSEIPKEVICEVDPASEHPEFSIVLSAILRSKEHYHLYGLEEVELLEGNLTLVTLNGEKYYRQGKTFTIPPITLHAARGNFTLVQITSTPGWQPDDHFLMASA